MTSDRTTSSRPSWPVPAIAARRAAVAPDGALGGAPHDRDASLWCTIRGSRRPSPSGWAGSTRRTTSACQIPAARGLRRGDPRRGLRAAVVGGMGGSSLAPDVLGGRSGWRGLARRCASSTRPTRRPSPRPSTTSTRSQTLFIVATKSGTTTEPLAFQADAWDRLEAAIHEPGTAHEQPGDFMVAITDPGKSVDAIPHHDQLRELFLNPPDIGGRYSRADLRRTRPGRADGARPRSAARVAPRRCSASAASHDPPATRALALGLAIGHARRAAATS